MSNTPILLRVVQFILCSVILVSATSVAYAAPFTQNLKIGDTNIEVKSLQEYLNATAFPVAKTGAGSAGEESDYFGSKTKSALEKFQGAHAADILAPLGLTTGTGNFFTSTRNFINQLLSQLPSAEVTMPAPVPVVIAPVAPPPVVLAPTPIEVAPIVPSPVAPAPVIEAYSVGGTVVGLNGSIVLEDNGADDITVNPAGNNFTAFTFPQAVTSGQTYAVTIKTPPSSQVCTILGNATGIIGNTNVRSVSISCSTPGGGSNSPTISLTPNVSLAVSPSSVTDDSGTPLVYTVTLDRVVATDTSVNFSVSGTAISGTDFAPVTSPLVIPAGRTTGTITLTPITHTTIEEDRTAKITLRAGTGYAVASPQNATVTIANDAVQTGNFLYLTFDGTGFNGSGSGYELLNAGVSPVTVVNPDPSVPLNVIFVGDFTLSSVSDYIVAGSDNIRFGSQTLGDDGSPTTITIHNVTNYGGFISNSGGFSDVSIINLSVEKSGTSTLASSAGWILRNTSSNVTVVNGASNGNISTNGGGIAGANTSNLTILGSFSTGSIGTNAGGIVGNNAQNVTVNNSYSTGSIGSNAGGIFGVDANNGATSSTDIATNSYSTGNIGLNAGGIFGADANVDADSSTVTVTNSYSTGSIGAVGEYNAGGIFGNNACSGATSSTCAATNSYSTGDIYGDVDGANGGIFGANATSSTVTNSYSTGPIGMYSGGIFADSATSSAATNSYSTGDIAADGGGIFGTDADSSTVTNSFSIGSVGTNAGGIFGSSSLDATATDCYVLGSTIFGASATGQTTSNCIEDAGTWTDVDAAAVLTSASWTSLASNTPYVFPTISISLATPYSIISANDDGTLNNSLSETIEKGDATVSALSGYNTFSIVSISGGSSSSYADITIDPTTGVISTTSDMDGGTYDIVVGYHNLLGGNSTSVFHLTVNN